MLEVQIFPLVPNLSLPAAARATTRSDIPAGYGVQEHCLPFTAANALGLLIKSPIAFGLCLPADVPPGCHSFRSPLDQPGIPTQFADERVFYVQDDPACNFVRNAFTFETLNISDHLGKRDINPIEPGISFFDRQDQLDHFKLHLPYIWHTPSEVDTLFLSLINHHSALNVLAGLVETDWYAHPVNLVLQKPPGPVALHVTAGEPVAQAIFLSRSQRRPALKVLASHARLARDLRSSLVDWYKQRARDRGAYKRLARSQHGRMQS